MNRFLHKQSAAGAADMSLVEVDSVDNAFDRLINRGILKNDIRRFASQLQRASLLGARDRFLDDLANLS